MSNNDMSRAVQSDERVWPDDDLRDIARDVAESNGTWLWDAPDKMEREVRAAMLNKYGTVRYCGPTRDNGIPFTTADVERVAEMLKGATITLPKDTHHQDKQEIGHAVAVILAELEGWSQQTVESIFLDNGLMKRCKACGWGIDLDDDDPCQDCGHPQTTN